MKLQQKKQKENYIWQLDKNTKDNPILHYRYMKTTFYCPLCGTRFNASEYLCETFKGEDKALWLANMVTHYRHTHITSWNKCWGWGGRAYRKAAHFGDYDTEKSIVNERAKRQIARKCPQYIISNGIDHDVYSKLQGTTEETLKLVDSVWSKHSPR